MRIVTNLILFYDKKIFLNTFENIEESNHVKFKIVFYVSSKLIVLLNSKYFS